MKSAFLIVNSSCYNHCLYCFYNTNTCAREQSDFKTSNIPSLIDFLNKNNITELMITGGDCLHESYFYNTCKIISEVRKKCDTQVHILSSSTNLDNDKVLELKKAGLKSVYISIDSVDVKTNDFLRGNTKKTLKAIKLYKNNNIELRATIVVSSKSYKDVERTYAFLKKLGFTEIVIQPSHLPDNYNDRLGLKIEALSKNELSDTFKKISMMLKEQNKARYAKLLEEIYINNKQILSMDCFMGRDKCVIKHNGDVMMCFHRSEKMGTIFDKNKLKTRNTRCSLFGKNCISLFSEKYFNNVGTK